MSAGAVRVEGDGIDRSAPLGAVQITEPLGTAPRLIRFAGGAYCSIDEHETFGALLAAHGMTPKRVTQWEGSVRWIVVSAALFIVVLIGDVSMLAAVAPTALLQAKYSRDLEREADAHAISVLDINGISREHFARMLERLEASAREHGAGDEGSLVDYLSSHPVTRERIERVQAPR